MTTMGMVMRTKSPFAISHCANTMRALHQSGRVENSLPSEKYISSAKYKFSVEIVMMIEVTRR